MTKKQRLRNVANICDRSNYYFRTLSNQWFWDRLT